MAKTKTSKSTELAGLEMLSNGLLVRKSTMEVVGIHKCADKNDLRHLVIPEGIKAIGANIFLEHREILSVSFPESLEAIGDFSFWMCNGLRKVNIPKSVKIIKASAFEGCSSLEEVELNEGLVIIENSAFRDTKVRRVDLPASVRALGDDAFPYINAINIRSTDLPHNLMRAISPEKWYGYMQHDAHNIRMTMEISVNERVIYLPKFIDESSRGLCECALNSGLPEMEENLFLYGKSGKPSYDTAFSMYSYLFAFGRKPSDELLAYIKRMGKKMMEYMIESNRIQDTINLVGFNILTLNALKSCYEVAIQRNCVEIAAYLMAAIKKYGKHASMQL